MSLAAVEEPRVVMRYRVGCACICRSVLGAVAGSAGLLVAALTARLLRGFLGLATPGPLGLVLVGAGAIVAVLLGRVRSSPPLPAPCLPHLPLPIERLVC